MYNKNKSWTRADETMVKDLYNLGATDNEIAERMGRSTAAVMQRRNKLKMHRVPKRGRKKSATYIRYEKPKTQVSLLWGLIKFSKA